MTSALSSVPRVRIGRRGGREARLLAVFLAVAVAPCLGGATQLSAVFEKETDAGSGNEVLWEGFASMSQFMASDLYGYFFSELDIVSTLSMGGFACDGHQYHMILESDTDAGGGEEVYLITYASLADFHTDTRAWGGFTGWDIGTTWTTHGFASDGTRYYMVLETDADWGAGNEVYVLTFSSLANFLSGTVESEGFSQINIASGWSTADLASDGEKFYLALESDTDAGSGAEIFVVTYASFADFLSDTQESAEFSSLDIAGAWSMNGFAAEIPIFEDGFESGTTSAWSSSTTSKPPFPGRLGATADMTHADAVGTLGAPSFP
jgi:hypothetical protein